MMTNGFIQLDTSHLCIRDHYETDFATHHALFSDETVMTYLKDIQTHSRAQSRENLAVAISSIAQPKRLFYFLRIEEKETGGHVGEIGYTVTDFLPEGKAVDIGYFTHKEFWGQGYVSEALREILRFAFEEDGVYYANCGCNKNNVGSERVMQKCNMIKQSEQLKKEMYDDGSYMRVSYQLTKPQWKKLKGL